MSRKPLFDRLPRIFHRLDFQQELERYLEVMDSGLDLVESKTTGLYALKSIDKIPDRYLNYIADQVGHKWGSDQTRLWNRDKIRNAIYRYSYKGSRNRLLDDLIELGAESIRVEDNAQYLLTWSSQGSWSGEDSVIETADFWHDGAFVLTVIDAHSPFVDRSAVEAVMHLTIPAGTIWYLQFGKQWYALFETLPSFMHGQLVHLGNARDEMLGFGRYADSDFIDGEMSWSWQWEKQPNRWHYPIYWHISGTPEEIIFSDGEWGYSDLSWDSTISPNKYFNVIGWLTDGTTIEDLLGSGDWGELGLSWESGIGDGWRLNTRCSYSLKEFDVILSSFYSRYWFLSDIFNLADSRNHTQFVQITNDELDPNLSQCLTSYIYSNVTAGAYLTGESNLPANLDSIRVNQGTMILPLTEYHASLQNKPAKTSVES